MNWNFIPSLPTAGAWKTRTFQRAYGLKDLVEELRMKLPTCQGQLVFHSDNVPSAIKSRLTQLETNFYIQYNHITELHEMLELIKWNEQKHLRKIAIYQHGYFIQ